MHFCDMRLSARSDFISAAHRCVLIPHLDVNLMITQLATDISNVDMFGIKLDQILLNLNCELTESEKKKVLTIIGGEAVPVRAAA